MIEKVFSSQLRINMASGLFSSLIYAALAAVSYPLYLYFLGYEIYGVWLLVSIVFNIAQIGSFGMSPAVLTLVAEERGRKDFQAARRYIVAAMSICCLVGLVLLGLIVVFKADIVKFFRISTENEIIAIGLLPLMAILSVYSLIVGVYNSALCGLGRMDMATGCDVAGRIAAVALSAFFLYKGCGIYGLFYGLACSIALMHLILLYFIRREAGADFGFFPIDIRIKQIKKLLIFGGGVAGGSLVSLFISPFNRMILSRYAGVAEVPVFEIAFSGAMQVRQIIEAFVKPISPDVSKLAAVVNRERIEKIKHIYRKVMTVVAAGSLPYYGLLVVFAAPLLQLWLGQRYSNAIAPAFQFCVIGVFISSIALPAFYTLMGLGNSKSIFFSQTIQAFSNCSAILLLIFMSGSIDSFNMAVVSAFSLACSAVYLIVQNSKTISSLTAE